MLQVSVAISAASVAISGVLSSKNSGFISEFDWTDPTTLCLFGDRADLFADGVTLFDGECVGTHACRVGSGACRVGTDACRVFAVSDSFSSSTAFDSIAAWTPVHPSTRAPVHPCTRAPVHPHNMSIEFGVTRL